MGSSYLDVFDILYKIEQLVFQGNVVIAFELAQPACLIVRAEKINLAEMLHFRKRRFDLGGLCVLRHDQCIRINFSVSTNSNLGTPHCS